MVNCDGGGYERTMSLADARTTIDALDDEILRLLNERARVVSDVASAKRTQSLPTYDPERERQVLERLAEKAGQFPAEAIVAVYREVMSACLALQAPVGVAFLGPEGTFSHAAARARFGLSARYTEQATLSGVFEAVARGTTAYGVVPIENSTEGSVSEVLDALLRGGVVVTAELEIDVSHALLSHAAGLSAIHTVYSHPQALGQCRAWLAAHLPHASVAQSTSTAAAVREAKADPTAAALASRLAGELYGVPVLQAGVNDRDDNRTRFVLLAAEGTASVRTGRDKTTLAFSIRDGRGALWQVLKLFDEEGINITRIHSRPSRQKAWDYVFFVDVEGHVLDADMQRAVCKLEAACPMVRKLGSYARV